MTSDLLTRVLECDCTFYPCPHFDSEEHEREVRRSLGLPNITMRDAIELYQKHFPAAGQEPR